MKLRVARHTADIDRIKDFYHEVLGLEVLGTFEGHNKYDGVFLGLQNSDWHLEFTVSNQLPEHTPDEDDLLVFYFDTVNEYHTQIEKIRKLGIEQVEPKNPYWKIHGATFKDPDGFLVVIALKK